uniref:BRCT domain-containing protein n=1 Tax=Anopheles farauti TaxID=69004 RepID=A0A182Q3E0_9DIPT
MDIQLPPALQLSKLFFVLRPDCGKDSASEDMKLAYSLAHNLIDDEELQCWITECECLQLDLKSITKCHVFVFEKFTGSAFEHAQKSPATVIGPRCFISCYMNNESVPLGIHPIYTTAMRNLTVCSSGLKPLEKSHVSQLVCQMGGYFMDVLTSRCTHLISSTVKSVKYEKAAEYGLPIMHPDWVNIVWEESQTRDVHATDKSLFERSRLPVFYALTITSTGLTAAKKNEIKALIEANGGSYVGWFKSNKTDVLILNKDDTESAKFHAAISCKKECLTPDWIVDSVRKGYVLPIREYEVVRMKASTPTKENLTPIQNAIGNNAAGAPDPVSAGFFNPDCTQLSEISHVNFSARNETINESMTVTERCAGGVVESIGVRPVVNQRYREILACMTVQQAKKVGSVLDGCNVFVSGFTAEEKEKLNKILNAVGAVRYDEISGAISHVIVGEQQVSELGKFRDFTAHLLTLEWLKKSIEQGQLASEEEYTIRASDKDIVDRATEPPSPSSKKNLQQMNSSGVFKRPDVPKFRLEEAVGSAPSSNSRAPNEEDSIMMQYMEKNLAEMLPVASKPVSAEPSEPSSSESDLTVTEFMLGKTLFVFGFSEQDAVEILSDIKECGGTIVDENYSDEVDYIVLPTSCIGTPEFTVRGKQTVNCIWLESSIESDQCCPMEYYYQPIIYGEHDPRPLENETVVMSLYLGPEREYLTELGKILGACVQDRLVRKAGPILVCKEPNGAKYDAAIQWNLTVVHGEWLLECIRQKRRVPENPYLVGDAICFSKNVTEDVVCLPTTSTDDVDIDSVREDPRALEQNAAEPSMHPQASSTMKPHRDYRYITVPESVPAQTGCLEYGFNRLSTPQLRELSSDDRMVYSQEMDQYEELMRVQRKSFDPNEGTSGVSRNVDSPAVSDFLRTRRFTAISEESKRSSAFHSPITPVGVGVRNDPNSTTVTPIGAVSDVDSLSVTQRVMDFDTPVRTTLYKVLKEAEEADRNITPRTRRVKELLATPHGGGPGSSTSDGHIRTPTLPECMTNPITPYGFRPDASPDNHAYHKRKLQHWDRYYKAFDDVSKPDQIETFSQKARRLSTPLSEIKRRFYVEQFGDGYANHVESKCTSSAAQSIKMYDLNSSRNMETVDSVEEEGIPCTAPPVQGVLPTGTPRTSNTLIATTSRDSLDNSNMSAGKRSRSDLEEEDNRSSEDEGNEKNDKSINFRSPSCPLAKKPLLSGADNEVECIKRLSDVIAAAKLSAKKRAKLHAEIDSEQIPTEQYTEMDYDTEMDTGVDGVVWREQKRENVEAQKSPQDFGKKLSSDSKRLDNSDMNRMKCPATPVFSISGVADNVRLELIQKIKQLNGQLTSDPNRYDATCTHILCGKPNRGEKMLSGIAAGKWLLSTKYLDDSFEAGYFLDEECYEWGNPKSLGTLTSLATTGDIKLFGAAYTWRKRIANDVGKKDGAFTGFRVLLVVPKKEQFIRLIQSGGGYVIELDLPFINSEGAMMATHCFVDHKCKLPAEDHRALAEAGIAVLSIMYLNEYLTSEKLPDPNNFQLSF